MAALRQSYIFRDHVGHTGIVKLYVPSTADGQALFPFWDVLTTAQFESARGPYTTPPAAVVYPVIATFTDCADKCVIVLADSIGLAHRFLLPAPRVAIFKPDQVTLDGANAQVQGFVAAMVAHAVTSSGNAFAALIGGKRSRSQYSNRIPSRLNPTP